MTRLDRAFTRLLTAAIVSAVALALLLPLAASAEEPNPPPYYAIRDARVVTVSGATLERATVLVADGLIEAVGANVAIPPDAWVIEGAGLTVYPGLIDALTTLGQEQAEASGDGPPQRGGGGPPGAGSEGPTIRGPEDRPKTTPWVSAADLLKAGDARVEKWRQAGFTTAVTAPADGFFAGQAAIVDLGNGEPRELVVATAVAQRLNLRGGRGFRDFPGSLMGVIAYLGQVFSDADHYHRALEVYEASPNGKKRPTYDRTLQPLVDAMRAGTPFLFPGDRGPEIDRALEMASRYKLRPVIYGAQGAYDRAESLRSTQTAVLVNLSWPKEESGRDPDAETGFRELYHRQTAPTTPKHLADAGVRFAFYSGDAGSPSDIAAGIRRAIDSGLSSDAALRALTLGAAEIFGVADRLGSVEAGKIANLVVSSAEPWAEGAEIKAVFVDGRYYAKPEPKTPAEKPEGDVTGTWKLTTKSQRGERESTARLTMAADGKVTGEVESERGTNKIEEGRLSGRTLSFKITQSMGPRTMEASYSAEVDGEKLAGSVSAGPMSMELAGERSAEAAAKEPAAGAGTAPKVAQQELDDVMALYHGKVRDYGSFAITGATVWTNTGEPIPNATVLVRDGKIQEVGASVAVPRGVEVIDGTGDHLIPGIIDAHSHIAVEGSVNEGSLAVTAMVGTGDVLDPDDISIYRALAGGVTSANILHGSANPIGGRNAVIKLRWGQDAKGLVFEGAPPGIKFALGENPKRSRSFPGAQQRYPASRMGVMDVVREAFVEAREYQKEWQLYNAAVKAGKQPIPPRVDFELQTLAEILEGKRLVHSHCYRADEILQLLRLADEFGFKVATLQHVLEGYKVADEIAAHGAGASTFSDWWGYKVEAYDAIPYNAALMAERGILVSINSDSGEEMRHLNQEAAKAIKWGGMSEVEALKLVTLNPAKQLRVDRWVGTIEPGKDADLVLYNGHPLSVSSVVLKTFVDGDLYFDRDADRVRQQRIDDTKKRLAGKDEKPAAEGDEKPTETPVTVTADTTPGAASHPPVAVVLVEEPR